MSRIIAAIIIALAITASADKVSEAYLKTHGWDDCVKKQKHDLSNSLCKADDAAIRQEGNKV